MLSAPVHFSAQEFDQFHKIKQDCEMYFGDIKLASDYAPNNGIALAGRTLNDLCAELNAKLSQYIHIPYEEHRTMLENIARPISLGETSRYKVIDLPIGLAKTAIYSTLIAQNIVCYSLSSTLANALHELPNEIKQTNEKLFHEITGYFRVLSCVLACNAILYSEDNNDLNVFNSLFPYVCIWTEQFETNHLLYVEDNPDFMRYYQRYSNLFQSIHTEIVRKYKNERLFPADLIKQVERKNALARLHNRTYHGEVVYCPETTRCFLPDPAALEMLLSKIKEIVEQDSYTRRQFHFYFNTELGHAELVDVSFDPSVKKLTILNINSADGSAQYYFLNDLSKALSILAIDFKIYSCQAAVQRDRSNCITYSFAYGGILSKIPVDKICQAENYVEQPAFGSCNAFTLMPFPALERVQWFSIEALGEKAILIGQSFENMHGSLLKLHPADRALQIRRDFMIEHGLNASGSIETKITYPQVLFKRMQARQNLPIGTAAIQTRLQATDLHQALRRSAAGLGPIDDLTELTHAFDTLSLSVDVPDLDPTKGFTPLHLAVTKGLSRQTAKLLRYGASPDAATRTTPPKTAKTIYAELPEGSRFKHHSEIKSRLS